MPEGGGHREPGRLAAPGIETIFQTLALADNLDSVATVLGRELTTRWGTLDEYAWKRPRATSSSPQPEFKTSACGAFAVGRAAPGRGHFARSVFQRQPLIMDEPCAALGPRNAHGA